MTIETSSRPGSRHGSSRNGRPRRSAGLVLALAAVLLAACQHGERPAAPAAQRTPAATTTTTPATTTPATTMPPPATTVPPAPRTLPRGGRVLFPRWRVVAFYGGAGTPKLGVLGEVPPEQVESHLLPRARAFLAAGRPVMPAFELIVTVANRSPGPSGQYRTRTDHAVVARYLRAVRKIKGLLILDVQPGRADFLSEVRYYERFLREPDVGLALDPEWSMGAHEVPGDKIGHTDAASVNRVSAWLAGIVGRERLPQKLLIVHQFTGKMVTGRQRVATPPGLAVTFHIDGFGTQAAKRHKYDLLAPRSRWHRGVKLFIDEDVDMLTPREAMGLRPRPDLVTYQ